GSEIRHRLRDHADRPSAPKRKGTTTTKRTSPGDRPAPRAVSSGRPAMNYNALQDASRDRAQTSQESPSRINSGITLCSAEHQSKLVPPAAQARRAAHFRAALSDGRVSDQRQLPR